MFPKIFLALHIPDGFISVPVAAVGWALMISMITLALRQTRDQFGDQSGGQSGDQKVPLMGILAAFVFAAQMINFPVAGGTSGHLLGGTLVAILLGPWAAVLVMTSVVSIQALLFQDGGLLALGFNVFNMGILTGFTGYTIYQWLRRALRRVPRGEVVAAVVAAWVSVVAAATATALQLAISGTSPLNIALPAMVGVHALIGIGEALITAGALTFIQQTRPDLIAGSRQAPARGSAWIAVGLVIALVITFASPLANPDPDGLERVAEDRGFLADAEETAYKFLPDYTVPGVDNEAAATILAGIIGVVIVTAAGYGIARGIRAQSAKDSTV